MREAAGSDPLIVDPASQTEGLRQAADALRRGSLRAALAALEKVVKASPRSSEAHRMLATAAALAGDTRTSVEHLEAALRIRPDDERSWIALANTHADAGALVEAARTLEKAIAAIPDSGGLRWRLAGLLVKARPEWRRAGAVQRGGAADASLGTGTGAPGSGHARVAAAWTWRGAAAAVDRRVRANLNDAAAHRDLASVYTKQGRQDEAFAELAIAAWLDPDDPLTLVALGHSLMADRRDERRRGGARACGDAATRPAGGAVRARAGLDARVETGRRAAAAVGVRAAASRGHGARAAGPRHRLRPRARRP